MTDTWPPDNPDAKDRLARHSFERCLADPEYAQRHSDWFRWAHGEQKRRVAAELAAKNREEVNAAARTRIERREAEDLERGKQAAESEDRLRQARNAQLAENLRRW